MLRGDQTRQREEDTSPVPTGGTVAVTGSAGFIGSWVLRRLLDKGYRVRACVRNANDPERTDFLRAMPGYVSGRLTVHSADLDDAGSFDDIFAGCHGVCHVSHVSDYNDLDQVRMVCDHMIESVNKSRTVTRVVVTSSVAAVIAETDVNEWTRRPVFYECRMPHRPRSARKRPRQERAPERYIASGPRKCTRWRRSAPASIERLLPELGHDTPEVTDRFPDHIKQRETKYRAIWAASDLRNDRIRAVTGIEFRPFDESLRDCVESLLSVAKVKPKLREGFSLRTSG